MIFEGMLKIRGGWLNCKLTGYGKEPTPGKPVMLVVPGGPGIGHEWYASHLYGFEHLTNILYFDPRGSGLSEHALDPSHYTMDAVIEDIESLRAHFRLDSIILFASGYGSIVATGYALKYPKYLHSLCLLSGAPNYTCIDAAKENLLQRGTAEQIQATEKLWRGDFANERDITQFFNLMATMNSVTYAKRPRPFQIKCSPDPLNQAYKTHFHRFNHLPKLGKITCPVRILVGEQDWLYPPSLLQTMVAALPQGTLKIIPNCGHTIFLDAPYVMRQWFPNAFVD